MHAQSTHAHGSCRPGSTPSPICNLNLSVFRPICVNQYKFPPNWGVLLNVCEFVQVRNPLLQHAFSLTALSQGLYESLYETLIIVQGPEDSKVQQFSSVLPTGDQPSRCRFSNLLSHPMHSRCSSYTMPDLQFSKTSASTLSENQQELSFTREVPQNSPTLKTVCNLIIVSSRMALLLNPCLLCN